MAGFSNESDVAHVAIVVAKMCATFDEMKIPVNIDRIGENASVGSREATPPWSGT